MNKYIKIQNYIFFIFLLFCANANAQNSLKSVDIEKYLTTLPLIEKLIRDYNDTKKESAIDSDTTIINNSGLSHTPISDSLEIAKMHPTYSDFLKIVKNAGFSSDDEWAKTGDKIMFAYSAYNLQKMGGGVDEAVSNLAEKLEIVKSNKFISTEQKLILTENIENSMALMNDPNYINNDNIQILKPYIERLESLLRNSNDTY